MTAFVAQAQTTQQQADAGARVCDYCHLPLADAGRQGDEPAYCCIGCRLAAEITGQSGQRGAAQWTLARLGLAIFLSLGVMMFTMVLWTQDLHDAQAANSGPLAASLGDLFRYLCLLLSLPVLFLLGAPMVENALGNWRRGGAATDLLIIVGVIAAYAYSAVSVLRGAGHVYFEVGCAVLVMVTLGRWLEAHGKLRTTEAIDSLEKLMPREARVVSTDGEVVVPLDQIQIGDRIRVLAGERVASDGRLMAGHAALDEHMLTGESHAIEKGRGDNVWGGSLNLDGDLVVEVNTRPEHSSLARIVEMVRHARLTRGRYQRAADRVAGWFLPAVIVVSIGAFTFHATRAGIDQGVLAGLAVLLIACPCALGLATPMAVWSALGSASGAGILFRDGESLERLAAVRALRFDKTGTLTSGAPRMRRFVANDAESRSEIVHRAASLARASTHAFSAAIADFVVHELDGEFESDVRPSVSTAAGQGVSATLDADESPTRLGNLRWLEHQGLTLDAELAREVDDARSAGDSISAIGWDGRVRGLFVFSETLRVGARGVIDACRDLGCDVAVLTGDHAARGRALARELDVDVQTELLPQDKVAAIEKARAAHGAVAMIGDGINDAPALAASDLGIAMGCGTDVSRESAAVCLASNELALLPWALALARRTRRTIRQNLFWAFAYNTCGIALAAAGWLNPVWAAVAMVGSSSLVVTNSLRLGEPAPQSTEACPRSIDVQGPTSPVDSHEARLATQPCSM